MSNETNETSTAADAPHAYQKPNPKGHLKLLIGLGLPLLLLIIYEGFIRGSH